MGKSAWFWRLAAGWALVIFVLSSIPGAAFPQSPLLSYDKVLHAGVYAVLGAFCYLSLPRNGETKTGTRVLIAGTSSLPRAVSQACRAVSVRAPDSLSPTRSEP